MARRRTKKPQNLGQNRNVQMRNNARTSGANMPFQGGMSQSPKQPQQCPTGQEPKMVNGRMQCIPSQEEASAFPKLKINKGKKPRTGSESY